MNREHIFNYFVRVLLWLNFISSTVVFRIKVFMQNIECGFSTQCWGRVIISRAKNSRIKIGNDVSLISSSLRCIASTIFAPVKIKTITPDASIIIGNNVGLNGTSITARSKKISIGDNTMIAPNVVIIDSDFHALWPSENRAVNPGFNSDQDVIIGKDVWIGMQAIILKGVTIGDGAVIGASSEVTENIPSNTLAAGVPAKVIKKLGSER